MEPLELLATFGPWVVAALAAYIGLKIGPVDRRLTKLEALFEQHLAAHHDDATNYDRWRGQVSAWLAVEKDDHAFIRSEIAKIREAIAEWPRSPK
jgi:hypothetical protein